MSSICPANSTGVSARPPLYSGYLRVRNVPPGRSKATATWVGSCSPYSRRYVERNPETAFVCWPPSVTKFSAFKA